MTDFTRSSHRPRQGLRQHGHTQLLSRLGMVRSMSRKGNCYDNAAVESFFSSLKNEVVHHRDFQMRDEARAAIFDYIELFYNRKRIHQSLDYEAPMEYERRVA